MTQPNATIHYAVEPQLTPDEFLDVLRLSGLSERRPVDDRDAIAGMVAGADVIITARTGSGQLVGVSRAISDRSYCTYLSELAVALDYQRQGVGRELVRRTHEAAGLNTQLILLAAPAAEGYYPRVGMSPHPSAWMIKGRARRKTPPRLAD